MIRALYTVAVFALLLSVLTLFGCGSAPKEPGRFYADDHDFSIKFPDGWAIEIEENGEVISAISPLDDEYDLLFETVSVSVENMYFEVDLDEYFGAVRRMAKSDFAWYDEEMIEDIMIGNIKAKKTVFTYEDDGEVIRTLGYCFVKDNKAYLITCISDDMNYDSYAADFEISAESFRFE